MPILLAEEKLLQMATASRERTAKTEEFMTNYGEEEEKSVSNVLVSSFQLKENLLSRAQMSSSTEAEGGNHCRAIRTMESLQLKIYHMVTQTAHTCNSVLACKDVHASNE